MPDQPADPINYEMKIPPEPQNANEDKESEKSTGDDRAPGQGGEQDTNATRNEENGQPGRQSDR